jgi:hypothetical protein
VRKGFLLEVRRPIVDLTPGDAYQLWLRLETVRGDAYRRALESEDPEVRRTMEKIVGGGYPASPLIFLAEN